MAEAARAGPRRFRYRDLASATREFSEEKKLGAGAFGAVYEGTFFRDDGSEELLAVKKMNACDRRATRGFLTELVTVSRTGHTNLVRLEGWCCRRNRNLFINFMCWCWQMQNVELFVVYELVPNGNLHEHLYKKNEVLSWATRYKIVKDIGRALRYLHHECDPYILHRDIKPCNILLDSAFKAKLADFGLSRVADEDNGTMVITAEGTEGYIDPECRRNGKVSFKPPSDVYGFGIVLLEIACTRHTSREQIWSLLHNTQNNGADARLLLNQVADPRLNGDFDVAQMHPVLVLGLCCSFPTGAQRPTMQAVMNVLEHGAPLPDLNPAPGPLPVLNPTV